MALAAWTQSLASGQEAVEVLSGLDTPVFVTSWPANADVLVVVERGSGRITRFAMGGVGGIGGIGGVPAQSTVLDLSTKAHIPDTYNIGVDNNGVTGVAFHPDFFKRDLSNRWLYARYNAKNTQETIVARYLIPPGTLTADLATEEILFRAPTSGQVHASGQIHFDTLAPDGARLYVAVGDSTHPINACCGAEWAQEPLSIQEPLSKLGKLLFIDGNGNTEQPGTMLGMGLRNPFGFSVDRGGPGLGDVWLGNTGDFCAGDVFLWKANTWNVENYGWPWWEGNCFVQDGTAPSLRTATCFADPGCADPGGNTYTDPVRVITTDLWTGSREALIGGYVYRAGTVTAFTNPDRYVFVLVGTGAGAPHPQVRSIVAANPSDSAVTVDHTVALGLDQWEANTVHGLGMDADGELYLIQVFAEDSQGHDIHENNGKIFKIQEP